MTNIYFDICSIPLFLMILFICYSRRMTKGDANQLFLLLVVLSLLSAVADLCTEIPDLFVPLPEPGRLLCSVGAYVYLMTRNANNVVLLLFLFTLTRTTFLLRTRLAKLFFFLPYSGILILLAQNPFTHNVFMVTAETGYGRGPLILAFYGIAMVYGLAGLCYCIYCRRYLQMNMWSALLSIYVLEHLAVLVQFFYPDLLLEMFCTSLGEMLILLIIMRPEERMDSEVGMLSWSSYQGDIKNILLSGEHVQIVAVRLRNCQEIRNYLGDHSYNNYLAEIANEIRGIRWDRRRNIELYYERPGNIYLIIGMDGNSTENAGERLLFELGGMIRGSARRGIRFEPQICLIHCPEDLQRAEEIISLGHIFYKMGGNDQNIFRACEIVDSRNFIIEARIEEILERAIRDDNIEMYYQPIYDVHTGRFKSAEALARLVDPDYGMISPGTFIPAAESMGYLIPIGDKVLDQVFRFIAEHDLAAMGLSYVEINLSVAQCMESDLPAKLFALQQKYGVDPGYVNLEITETTFENINEIMLENITRLIRMGYSFALDDYGIGYSNIQRVNHIPLKFIKMDKSMLDDAFSTNGRMIMEYTVRMMQSIGKQLVAEGAETRDEVKILKNMNCDYIQGFYFSRPLPAAEFVSYLEQQR